MNGVPGLRPLHLLIFFQTPAETAMGLEPVWKIWLKTA
jgi:hypothetical protein